MGDLFQKMAVRPGWAPGMKNRADQKESIIKSTQEMEAKRQKMLQNRKRGQVASTPLARRQY